MFFPTTSSGLWVERLVANGFREVGTFDGLNDVDNMLTTINVARRLGVKTFGALSYGLSPVHTDELYVRTAKDLVKRGKVDAIWLKDAGGLLTVDRIRTLVPAIKKVIGNIPLELHSHCMTGVAPHGLSRGYQGWGRSASTPRLRRSPTATPSRPPSPWPRTCARSASG